MTDTTVTIHQIRSTIRAAYSRLQNWRKVGEEFGLTSGMVYRIAEKGYEPKEAHIRHALGLSVFIPTPACPKCGEVHTIDDVCIAQSKVDIVVYEMTAEEYQKTDKPVTITIKRRPRKKDSRPRATINTANPESAAQTIKKKMNPDMLALLVQLLKE